MKFSFSAIILPSSFCIRLAAVTGLMLLLNACGLFTTTSTAINPYKLDTYKQRLSVLNAITEWHIQGKISVTKAGKNTSGALQWWHHPDAYRLNMIGPFGQGKLAINGNQFQAIALVDDDIIVANNINTLFDKNLGWPLPITDIEHWLLGIVDTDTAQEITITPEGHIVSFIGDSWRINLSNYKPNTNLLPGQQVWLPSKVTLAKQDILLKAIIKQWQPLPDVW